MAWIPSAAAAPPGLGAWVDAYVSTHQSEIVAELEALVSIPNIPPDSGAMGRNAERLRGMLERRGFGAEIIRTAGSPLILGERKVKGARRTLLLYAHYDGQPVDAAEWAQPTPFTPILRDVSLEAGGRDLGKASSHSRLEAEWRLYARSVADDKGPIVALCAALDALQAHGLSPTSNLRVVLDGEEESGSPSLVAALPAIRQRLAADLMLFFDGPAHPCGRPTIVFGVRGQMGVEITVYGPRTELHSGHYGNWVANPAARLTRLLASMRDDEGRVLVKGFYDDIAPLTPEEREMLRSVPDDPQGLMKLFGIAAPERSDLGLQDALQLPALNLRGLSSADVGRAARTIIPDQATASIDVRLVKETPARETTERIRAHIRSQGYHLVESDPDDTTRARHPRLARVSASRGTEGYRTRLASPQAKLVIEAVTRARGERPVLIRTMGGTLPIAPIADRLGVPAIVVPTVNYDNHQHAANENLRLGHLFESIVTMVALLRM